MRKNGSVPNGGKLRNGHTLSLGAYSIGMHLLYATQQNIHICVPLSQLWQSFSASEHDAKLFWLCTAFRDYVCPGDIERLLPSSRPVCVWTGVAVTKVSVSNIYILQ